MTPRERITISVDLDFRGGAPSESAIRTAVRYALKAMTLARLMGVRNIKFVSSRFIDYRYPPQPQPQQ